MSNLTSSYNAAVPIWKKKKTKQTSIYLVLLDKFHISRTNLIYFALSLSYTMLFPSSTTLVLVFVTLGWALPVGPIKPTNGRIITASGTGQGGGKGGIIIPPKNLTMERSLPPVLGRSQPPKTTKLSPPLVRD
jgi:hypothetical protein